MSLFNRRSLALWLLVLLACAPLLLFAYLGLHSRMIHDDFGVAARGLNEGVWDGFVRYYQNWTSAYSSIPLRLALARYAVTLPPIFTTAMLMIGVLALYGLLSQVLDPFRLAGGRRAFALAGAVLALAVSVNAFYTPEPFYWYSANVQYGLPLVALLACLALAGWTLRRARSGAGLYGWAAVCGAICFLTAGASEMFLVFQAAFLLPLAVLSFAIAPVAYRRGLTIVAFFMLLATAAGALIQLASPGIWARAAVDAENYGQPIRSLPRLALVTLQVTFESVGRPESIAGFTLLCALGMALGLRSCAGDRLAPRSLSAAGFRRACWLGLAMQSLFLPVLWAHQSDLPLVLGRFGARYLVIIGLNLALLLLFSMALWRGRRLIALLDRSGRGPLLVAAGLLCAYLLLVAMTQLRSIDARASTYLFASALGMLLVLALLCGGTAADAFTRRLGMAALGLQVIAWLTVAALIGVTFIGHGFTSQRVFAGSACLQVSAGFFWGLWLGRLLASSAHGKAWRSFLVLGCLLTVTIIAGGIFFGQARLIPRMRAYASEWDARHATIISLRDAGQRHIQVAPLSFDLAKHIGMGTLSSAHLYYGLESLEESDH